MQIKEILSKSSRALWICAHPDDENSSGGLVARAKDVCGELFMVSVTRGENSDILWNGLGRGAEIGRAREELFAQSATLFKADGYELGPFVNGPHTVEDLNSRSEAAPFQGWPATSKSSDVIEKWTKEANPLAYFVETLRKIKPQVAMSMDEWCGVSGNPEHIAVGKLLLQAIPLAADSGHRPDLGDPWSVDNVIFTANVIPPLRAIDYKKCEGEEPKEPIEELLSLEDSKTHGMTYVGCYCRVARNYQNTMQEKGWSLEEMSAECNDAEARATRAFAAGEKSFPIYEPYRVKVLR